MTSDYSRSSRVRTSGDGSFAGDAVKTECDERVAQRCGESARLAPVQKHERERGMFLRLHHEIPGMRIGVENGFGEVRKTADRGQGVEKQAGQHRAGIRSRVERREAERPRISKRFRQGGC